ncbi:MAG: hypothetical protein KJ622_05370 [Alphaproteobacteria bacterium]|nr:hypothetical protein [Alphaproteobacteria bacterium]
MTDTKHRFTSFAAPTPEDMAAFDALPEDEQRAIIEAELAKGFTGKTVPLTRDTMNNIKARVLDRVAKDHAQSKT